MPTLAAVSTPVCTRLPRFARARRHSEQRWLSRRPPLPRAGFRSGAPREPSQQTESTLATDRGHTVPRCIVDPHHAAILNFIFVLVHCPRTPSVQSCRRHCRGSGRGEKKKSYKTTLVQGGPGGRARGKLRERAPAEYEVKYCWKVVAVFKGTDAEAAAPGDP